MSKDDKIYNQYHTNTLEAFEAFFSGHAYNSHRHDTFAVGLTLSGVQSFHYGGCVQHNIPGSTMVLYPDEKHDGMAGTQAGFHYKMVYIKPELIQQVLRGSTLPFIKNGISQHPILFQKVKNLLSCLSPSYRDELEEEDAFYALLWHCVMYLEDYKKENNLLITLWPNVPENISTVLYKKLLVLLISSKISDVIDGVFLVISKGYLEPAHIVISLCVDWIR